ncbi:unnamed protein product [Phaeothamnion confervicola]
MAASPETSSSNAGCNALRGFFWKAMVRRRKRPRVERAVCFLLSLCLEPSFGQDIVISDGSGGKCALSTKAPRLSKYRLNFCNVFPEEACCLPAHDEWMRNQWAELMSANTPCINSQGYRAAASALQVVWCFGCSPAQPDYTLANSTASNSTGNSTATELRICKSLVDRIDLNILGECGMVVPDDRYQLTCGGDAVVVPPRYWPNATAFLNDDSGGKPVFFEDTANASYVVVVIDDEAGDETPCLGRDASGASAGPWTRRVSLLALLLIAATTVTTLAGVG